MNFSTSWGRISQPSAFAVLIVVIVYLLAGKKILFEKVDVQESKENSDKTTN